MDSLFLEPAGKPAAGKIACPTQCAWIEYPAFMESKVTRRQLAAALAGGTALLGQTTSAPPKTPDDELKAAREQCRQFGDQLGKFVIPMSTEPAFQFKA